MRAHKEDWEAERAEKKEALGQRDLANQRLAHIIANHKVLLSIPLSFLKKKKTFINIPELW